MGMDNITYFFAFISAIAASLSIFDWFDNRRQKNIGVISTETNEKTYRDSELLSVFRRAMQYQKYEIFIYKISFLVALLYGIYGWYEVEWGFGLFVAMLIMLNFYGLLIIPVRFILLKWLGYKFALTGGNLSSLPALEKLIEQHEWEKGSLKEDMRNLFLRAAQGKWT